MSPSPKPEILESQSPSILPILFKATIGSTFANVCLRLAEEILLRVRLYYERLGDARDLRALLCQHLQGLLLCFVRV